MGWGEVWWGEMGWANGPPPDYQFPWGDTRPSSTCASVLHSVSEFVLLSSFIQAILRPVCVLLWLCKNGPRGVDSIAYNYNNYDTAHTVCLPFVVCCSSWTLSSILIVQRICQFLPVYAVVVTLVFSLWSSPPPPLSMLKLLKRLKVSYFFQLLFSLSTQFSFDSIFIFAKVLK